MEIEKNQPRITRPTGTPPPSILKPFKGIYVEISKIPTELRSSSSSSDVETDEETSISLTDREISSQDDIESIAETSENVLTNPDTLSVILGFVPSNYLLSMQMVTKLFRDIIKSSGRASLQCPINKLTTLSKELEAARSQEAKTKQPLSPQGLFNINFTEIKTARDAQRLRLFLEDPDNEPFLSRIEGISFDNITDSNVKEIRELLNFITENADKLPQLTSLSFKAIFTTKPLTIPELPDNLISLSFGSIFGNLTLRKLPQNLNSLSFGNITSYLTLPKLPQNLNSLSFGDVFKDLTLPELPENLNSLSFEDIFSYITFPRSLPANLTSFHHGSIPSEMEQPIAEFQKQVNENKLQKLNRSKPEKRKAESTGPETKKRRIGPNGSDSQSTAPGMDLS